MNDVQMVLFVSCIGIGINLILNWYNFYKIKTLELEVINK